LLTVSLVLTASAGVTIRARTAFVRDAVAILIRAGLAAVRISRSHRADARSPFSAGVASTDTEATAPALVFRLIGQSLTILGFPTALGL
jgi:hypothetical protein